MSISIRMKKMGKKGQPFFRLVVADTLGKREGRYIENLGWYNPLAEGENYNIKQERVEYWLSQGARISNTARSIINKLRAKPKPAAETAETPAAAS